VTGWRPPSAAFAVAGSFLLLLGILAGAVNRSVVDGARFAEHVDAIRADPVVARQIGTAITGRLLAADPDLVAVRPLLEAAATSLVSSPAFGPVVRAAARQAHRALTSDDPGQIVLRLADLGVLLAGVVRALAPSEAARIPADVDLTLAQLGSRTVAARTVRLTRAVGVLAWLLPLLALGLFAAGAALPGDRRRATVLAGRGVVAAGAGVGAVALAGSLTGTLVGTDSLRGALVSAAAREFGGTLWWAAAVSATAGALVAAGAVDRLPRMDIATAQRAWRRATRPSPGPWWRIGRGAAAVLVGLGLVLRPALVARLFAVGGGILLAVAGVGELTAPLRAGRPDPAPAPTVRGRPAGPSAVAGTVGVVALLVVVLVGAVPSDRTVPAVDAEAVGCNGHEELCDRGYADVAFPATHNAMAAADEPGWFLPEQPTGLVGQLDAGIRVLLIDTWYGRRTSRAGLVATAPQSHAAALAAAERDFGKPAVDSALRIRDAVTARPIGPVRPYLCHGLCEIGATEWEPEMSRVRAWLDAHPREVVTVVIEDSVSPADTAAVFDRAGLLPMVHSQPAGRPWPTLGAMIDSGRRVVVMMERHGGGAAYPWLLPAFDWVQDTPFRNPTAADLSCRRERGAAGHPLLLVNYWLGNDFRSLVTDARAINALAVLGPYLAQCEAERGTRVNFVAVNYFDQGDLFRAVDELNGVG
jgi:hypothetical protein